MIEFTRDEQALVELEELLSNPDQVLEDIAVNLAEESLNLIKEGFDDQADPYGGGWAPKKRADGRNILTGPTGNLKSSWHEDSVDADGFVLASAGVEYASYHQSGTSRMVARRMVPEEGDIPPTWDARFNETVEEFLGELFGS